LDVAAAPEKSLKKIGRGKSKPKPDVGDAVAGSEGPVPRNKARFKIDERILGASYIGHGELYEAVVLKVRADKKNGEPVWQYMLHYKGWAKKWEEWVSEDDMHRNDEEGKVHQAEIKARNKEKRELEKKKKSAKKVKVVVDPESNIDKDEIEPKDKSYKVTLPPMLQRRLLDDLDMVEERKLLSLPRSPCVKLLLKMFEDASSKRSKTEQTAVKSLCQSLEQYFDMALPRILLFSFEAIKYKTMKLENPGFKPSEMYGGEHLLRLLMKIPSEMNNAKIASGTATFFQPRLQELVKFIEKNESTIMCNEWEPADTDYVEAHQQQLEYMAEA